MKKTLIIIGIVIGSLFIFGVVLKIVDPEGVERRASKRIKAAKQVEQVKKVKKAVFQVIAEYTEVYEGTTEMIYSYYTTELDPKKIEKFAESVNIVSSRRVLSLFFNDRKHIPKVAQLKDWWTDGSETVKNKKRLFRDYFVACYRSNPKIKRGSKYFQHTELRTSPGACGL